MRKARFYSPHQAGNEEGWQPVGDIEDVLSEARGGLQAGSEGGRVNALIHRRLDDGTEIMVVPQICNAAICRSQGEAPFERLEQW